jgi:hypothetical protein
LPDGLFLTRSPNLDKFWRALDWKMLIYFMAIGTILWIFGIFYDHLVPFLFIWYIFPGFGNICQEKSGNPAGRLRRNRLPCVTVIASLKSALPGRETEPVLPSCRIQYFLTVKCTHNPPPHKKKDF